MFGDVFQLGSKSYGMGDLPPRFVFWRTKNFFTIKDLDTRLEIALVNEWRKIKPLREVLTSYMYSNHVRSSEVVQMVRRLGLENPNFPARWVPTLKLYQQGGHALEPLYRYRAANLMRKGLGLLPLQSLVGMLEEIQSYVDEVVDKNVLNVPDRYDPLQTWSEEVWPDYLGEGGPNYLIRRNYRLDFHQQIPAEEVAARLQRSFEKSKYAVIAQPQELQLWKVSSRTLALSWSFHISDVSPDHTNERDPDHMYVSFGTQWTPKHLQCNKIPMRW